MSAIYPLMLSGVFAVIDDGSSQRFAKDLNCDIGPVHRVIDEKSWQLYGCQQSKTVVVVAVKRPRFFESVRSRG